MGKKKLETRSNILSFPRSDNQRFQLAIDLYSKGHLKEALEKCISLINDGYGHAYTLAGAILEEGGSGVDKDLKKALFYYQKAVDEVGAVEGWLALGRFYYFGKGVEADYKKAFYYYSVVDEDTENAIAWLRLGLMLQHGYGSKIDINRAREYFKKAIDKGYVFGWTYLGILEMECGHYIKGLWYRLRAGITAFRIAHSYRNDPRLRNV